MSPAATTTRTAPQAPLACLGAGWVRHVRRSPQAHAFGYPTWAVCLPMQQPQCWGVMRHNRAGLVSFHDADHGEGRGEPGAALTWAQARLAEAGVDCRPETREIWLLTYPRVCGLVFKPVSFWLVMDRRDAALQAVLAEVNNTFGQRMAYVLPEAAWGRSLAAEKRLHVSPFLAVEGAYAFRFMRRAAEPTAPSAADQLSAVGLGAGDRLLARIDLWAPVSPDLVPQGDSVRTSPCLETSLALTLAPATTAALLRLGWSWPALALLVWLRIHWQAWKLWRLGLTVFRLPPAPAGAWVRPGWLWGRRRLPLAAPAGLASARPACPAMDSSSSAPGRTPPAPVYR